MKKTSIVAPDPKPCAFCAYLRGENPYTFVFRDETIAILVTREQRGAPHVLVIPVQHAETLLDISDEQAATLAIGIREAAKAIEQEYSPEGIYVWQNNGKPASQTIGHVHFHVAGTLEKGGTEWGKVPELDLQETEKIAIRLRPYFKF
jgi:histidine triad (HIT) family protein